MMNYHTDITSEIRKTTSQELKAVRVKEESNYLPLAVLAAGIVVALLLLMVLL